MAAMESSIEISRPIEAVFGYFLDLETQHCRDRP